MNATRRQDGFTLIETLIAGLMLTLVLLALAQAAIQAQGGVARGAAETIAASLVQQRIEWLRNQDYAGTALAVGKTSETLGGAYAGYRRSTLVEVDVPRTGLKRITVVVETPNGGSSTTMALVASR